MARGQEEVAGSEVRLVLNTLFGILTEYGGVLHVELPPQQPDDSDFTPPQQECFHIGFIRDSISETSLQLFEECC